MIGSTATGNWGKLNSSTNVITGQTSTVQINTLTGSLMAGYNEYKLLQSGANGASDITSGDIVEYLLNASGGTYDSIDNAMVVAMITNALTKETREYMMANLGILSNALKTIRTKKETPATQTEDVFVQTLIGGGAYSSNGTYGTVGFTLAASVRTEIAELKALLRTGTTFANKGLYNFSWGQGLLNKWGAAGLFRVVPGSVSTSGLYDGGATGDFFAAKDSIAVSSSSLIVNTTFTGLLRQGFALAALTMVQEAMKAGSEKLDLVKVKTATSKQELTIGTAQVVGTTLQAMNGNGALDNGELNSLLSSLSTRSDFEQIKREFAIGAGHAQNAGGIYGVANSGPSGISSVFTVGFDQANTVTYSQAQQDLCAKLIQSYFWSCLSLVVGGDSKATPIQTANKGSQDTMVEILNMIFNTTLVRDDHDLAVQRASLLDMLRVYAFGPALALVSLDSDAAKSEFNAAINSYVGTASSNANHPQFDFNDSGGNAITSLTMMIPKATAALSASIVAVNDELLNYAYANAGFDLNFALVFGVASNAPRLMVPAYLIAQGINGEDQFPEDQVLEDDEVAVLVAAGIPKSELLKMVAVEFNINGYSISNEESRRALVKRSR